MKGKRRVGMWITMLNRGRVVRGLDRKRVDLVITAKGRLVNESRIIWKPPRNGRQRILYLDSARLTWGPFSVEGKLARPVAVEEHDVFTFNVGSFMVLVDLAERKRRTKEGAS